MHAETKELRLPEEYLGETRYYSGLTNSKEFVDEILKLRARQSIRRFMFGATPSVSEFL